MNKSYLSPEEMSDLPPRLSRLEAKLAEAREQIARLQHRRAYSYITKEDADDVREQLSLLRRIEKVMRAELITLKSGVGGSKDA